VRAAATGRGEATPVPWGIQRRQPPCGPPRGLPKEPVAAGQRPAGLASSFAAAGSL